jgi:CRISPR-associated protein Cas1
MLTAPDFEQKQIIFALISDGDKLSFKNDNIIIKSADGTIKHQSTCYRLFALFIVGHICITSGLLQRAEKFGFSIVFMTPYLRVYGFWGLNEKGNVLLRRKQYDYKGLEIARRIVSNKINNQLETLKSIRQKSRDIQEAIINITRYQGRSPENFLTLQDLLGYEGIVSRIYFKAVFCEYGWTARRPRVKNDMTNCLLDIGYTLLFNIVEALLNIYGFDLYQGVYHRQFYQRKSLVCDLVEPIRPVIDTRIRKAYNLGQIKEEDFETVDGQFRLYGKKSKPYISWLMEELLSHKKNMFLFTQGYYRAFMKNVPINQYPQFNI